MRKRFIGFAVALAMAMTAMPAMPGAAASAADDQQVINVRVSEDAHTQMWSTQAPYNYGALNYLKVQRPNDNAAAPSPNDAYYGRFGELFPGPAGTNVDGNAAFLKFNLTAAQKAQIASASGVKAELVMTLLGRRNHNPQRSTSQNLIVRSVGNNWTEGAKEGAAASGTEISANYIAGAASGVFAVPTSAATVDRSAAFNPQAGYSGNPSTNAAMGAGAAVAGTRVTTDISDIVAAMAAGDTALSLAVCADDAGCQQTFFVSKEGAAGGLTNATADMAPTLVLTLTGAVAPSPTAVKYGVSADGGPGATTTAITITFDKPVTGLTMDDIALNPASAAAKAGLTASSDGMTWTLALSVAAAGAVSVSIADSANFTFSYAENENTAELFKASYSPDVEIIDSTAREINFDKGWKFFLATRTPSIANGGSGASGFAANGLADAGGLTTAQAISPDFDDSGWRSVTVPHDFSIEGDKVSSGSNSQGYLQGGLGWYRKTFALPEAMRGKKVSIEFEGVYQDSVVYVNGANVGNYPSGYTGFAYDISDLLKYGADGNNLVTVKVQNMAPSGRWYTGSGIIRPVHLIVTNKPSFVRNGIVYTAPALETTYNADKTAVLNVRAALPFDPSVTDVGYAIRTTVTNLNVVVASHTSAYSSPPAVGGMSIADTVTVPNVHLWSLDDPFLYTVTTELLLNGVAVDSVSQQYGFRYYNVDTSNGLYINGVYTKLKGVDLHHDSGAVGAAAYPDAFRREITVLKSMGVNAYRTSHCPPSKEMIDVCSEMGMVVMEEAYDGWGAAKSTYDFGNFFLTPVPDTFNGLGLNKFANMLWSDWVIEEMVSRDINQPCVMLWSLGNEIRGVGTKPSWYDWNNYWRDALDTWTKPALANTTFNEFTEALRLRDDVYDVDPTRCIVMGGDQQRTPAALNSTWGYVNQSLDGFGLNYNTAASVDGLINTYKDLGRRGTFFFESESSSQTSARGKYYTPSEPQTPPDQTPGSRGTSSYDNNFSSWTMPNEYGLKKDRDRKAFAGEFIWSGFDYIGEPTPYSVFPVGVSSFGTIDTAGFPKDSYYLFKSQWTSRPMAHIVPMNWTDYQPGQNVEVWVNTNQPQAELFINDRSLGVKSFDQKTTNYGLNYYETTEPTLDGQGSGYKTGADVNPDNPAGYVSPNGSYGKLHLTWNVPFEPGELSVVAMDKGGVPVANDSVKTASAAYTIQMTPDKTHLEPDGTSLLYVECDVVDKDGVMLPSTNNLLKFDVTGNGEIFGVDNGKPESAEAYKWGGIDANAHSERSAYNGKALCIIRSKTGTGEISLTASADNLLPATLTIPTAPSVNTPAPAVTHPDTSVAVSAQTRTVNVPQGDVTTLPRDVRVTFASGVTLPEEVTWDAVDPSRFDTVGAFTVGGTFMDPSITAAPAIKVNVMPAALFERKNIGLNTAAGAQDVSSAAGPLATATFTNGSNYPNNMLNGNTTSYWDNYTACAATVVLNAVNAARADDTIQTYWPNEKTFDQVSLYFTTDANNSLPASLKAQYWDGFNWVDAAHQAVTWAAASNAETKLTFDRVTSSKVRVYMVSSAPLSATTGRIRVTKFETYGEDAISSAAYTLSYNANGGSGSVPDSSWLTGSVVKLAVANAFTAPLGRAFKEWNTAADGSGASYAPMADFIIGGADTTLYAIWEDAGGQSFDVSARNIDFDDGWKFFLATRTPAIANGGTGGAGYVANGLADAGGVTTADVIAPGFDDSSWRSISVPHDFSIEGPKTTAGVGGQGYSQAGLGWYRKTFSLPEEYRGSKRISIDFDGVYADSVVYLNGRLVGNYPSGYSGFAYDITNYLNFGADGPNVLVVKVQNISPSGRWYSGSGIIRPVTLVVANPTRIVRNGVTLTSPGLEAAYKADGSAVLGVRADVYSDDSNGVIALRTTVTDADGAVVATHTSANVDSNPSSLTTLQDTVTVPKAHLWSTDDPYRYNVMTEVLYARNGGEGTIVSDVVSSKYGFRWVKIDPAKGVYVNDGYIKLHGVDLHHDEGALGAAANYDALKRELTILKSEGVNSYRTSHCPPSKLVIDLCSELGIVVMEEAYDSWGSPKVTYDFGVFFLQPVPAGFPGQLNVPLPDNAMWSDWVIKEMVQRDKNEPCVIMWSIGNEIGSVGTRPSWYNWNAYFRPSVDTYAKPAYPDTQFDLYTETLRLRDDILDVDGTRYVVCGTDKQRTPPAANTTWAYIDQALNGVGVNYNTAPSVDALMKAYPNTFFFESESSSQTSSRGVYSMPSLYNTPPNQTPGSRGTSSYDNNFSSWTMPNEYGLKKDRDRLSFAGQYIWSGFDYIGEPTPYGVYPVSVSSFGTIDTAGFPKDSYYLFKSQWTSQPMAHIVPMNWNGYRPGELVEVWVNTNQPQAELFLNGKSLGVKSFDQKTTNYGLSYYETTEVTHEASGSGYFTNSDKNPNNPDGYVSPNGSYGKLHLTWYVPYAPGELKVVAMDKDGRQAAADSVKTAGAAYTIDLKPDKTYIKPDGRSLLYVECDVVDQDGVMLPDARNLIKFDVSGNGMIVGVDNGAQESAEMYKWGGADKSTHSERTAYNGKALVIIQSEKGTGDITLTASSDDLVPTVLTVATRDGVAPGVTHPALGAVISVEDKAVAATAGCPAILPRDLKVTYSGSVTLIKKVTWDAVDPAKFASPGSFAVNGAFEDTSIGRTARLTVNVAAPAERANLALNTAAGNQDTVSATGPLATASFTSGTNYPNNMLNGNTTNYWDNWASAGATVVYAAVNNSRPYDYVQVYWPSEITCNQISLRFVTNANYALPKTLNVQYWDGFNWIDAPNQAVTKATASGGETKILFGTVTASKLRVGMENATPLNATAGRMRITNLEAYLNLGQTLTVAAADGNVTAAFQNYTAADASGQLIIAAYSADGRLAWTTAKALNAAAGGGDALTAAVPPEYSGYAFKAFAWDKAFAPYCPAASGVLP